ncbi:MAG: CvpA family protein [Gammaproteobacteria bacterium]|jgi:membrane protein required for colicin V production
MNIADYVILGTIAVSMIVSLMRGFTVEALSLVTWVAAFVVARLFSLPMAVFIADFIDPPSARQPLAFVALFVMTLIVGALVRHLVKEVVNATGLSGTDRALGTVFGALRGALLVVVALAVLSRTTQMPGDPWWQQSVMIPHFLLVETWTAEVGRELWDKIMAIGSR